jgi:hypothetical protein
MEGSNMLEINKAVIKDGRIEIVSTRTIDPHRCPHCIFGDDHYREDGSCRCDDPDHQEMAEWGYVWDGTSWASPPEEQECD